MSVSTPSFGQTPSQRTLAAIVFTDVVSFSARMHADEVGTLKLLQRDFAEMRRICVAHEGAVLKTTGDGLLLTFTSAVQAVACALAMQRQFADEAKALAPGVALLHRIGIHLGDVLVQDEDVMGDGVNIASRLQAEAEPGGICISQTVYDVVKNKLELQVVSLGARDLKNIAQAMPVYRLLLEAQSLEPSIRSGPTSVPYRPPPAPASKRTGKVVAIVVALAVVAVAAVLISRRSGNSQVASTGAAPPAAPAASPAVAPASGADTDANGDLATDLAAEIAKHKDTMQELHSRYLDKYDFNGLVAALRDKAEGASAPRELQQLLRSAETMVRMKSWLELALGRYTQQRPLHVRDLSGDATRDVSVYLASDLRMVVIEKGVAHSHEWTDLKPPALGSVIVSALHEARIVQRGVIAGAQAFARLYSVPGMIEALATEKTRHEKETPGK